MDVKDEIAQELNIVRLGLMLGRVHEEIGNFNFAESHFQAAEEASQRIQAFYEGKLEHEKSNSSNWRKRISGCKHVLQ
ncbi:hypothetical protein Pryu01_03132 [Paraliobacillus ryukyuensis]|uniref:Tetratricopeptide repeat protein n=1 Tax=Paraliobacillus ryukyuensis TaxID=200904 RepID=A0A366DM06_9BACI|nr:hypothetical protein DES48_1211 [Paraliobacillus ryukyuensis]